jgi:hypothetical protein
MWFMTNVQYEVQRRVTLTSAAYRAKSGATAGAFRHIAREKGANRHIALEEGTIRGIAREKGCWGDSAHRAKGTDWAPRRCSSN